MGPDSSKSPALRTHRTGLPLAFVLACLAFLCASSAFAQNGGDDDDEDEAPAPVNNRAAAMIEMQRANIERNFDMWVFGQGGNASSSIQHLKSRLDFQIHQIDEASALSSVQKKKLLLGGEADIKHFLDRVEAARQKVRDLKDGPQNINIALQEAQPLQQILNSHLFGNDSMFHKIIGSTLSAEQFAKYQAHERKARERQYRAIAGWSIQSLVENLGLSDAQRRAFSDLVLTETRAPRQIGRMQQYVVLLQISKIPRDKLQPIFDDLQWPAFSQQLNQARMLERHLMQNGYVPGDDDPSATDASSATAPARLKRAMTDTKREPTKTMSKD